MDKQTFILIKPDAIERQLGEEILDQLRTHGLIVLRMKKVIVSEKQILTHYSELIERLKLDYIRQSIIDEFVGKLVWVIAATMKIGDPIKTVRDMIGPTDPAKAEDFTIRGRYGKDTLELSLKEHRLLKNLIHASDSLLAAQEEMKIWF